MIATYRVTNETRLALALFAEDLVDIAAQGNAPGGLEIADMIEGVLEDGYYEPVQRDQDGRVIGDD